MIPHIPHEELLFLEDPRTTNKNSKDAFGHKIVKKEVIDLGINLVGRLPDPSLAEVQCSRLHRQAILFLHFGAEQ